MFELGRRVSFPNRFQHGEREQGVLRMAEIRMSDNVVEYHIAIDGGGMTTAIEEDIQYVV